MSVKDLLELYQLVKEAEEEGIDIEDLDIEDIEDIDIEDFDIDEEDLDEDVVEEAEEMLDYADALEKTAELYRMAALEGLVKSAALFRRKRIRYLPIILAGGTSGAAAGALASLIAKKKKKRKKHGALSEISKLAQQPAAAIPTPTPTPTSTSASTITSRLKEFLKKLRLKEFLKKNWPALAIAGGGLAGGLYLARARKKKED